MQPTTEEQKVIATVPVGTAKRFLAELNSAGGTLNGEVAQQLRSQISLAELKGINQIDIESAIILALTARPSAAIQDVPLPTHRDPVQDPVPSDEPEVDDSIDHLVDLVIDLR